MYSLRDLEQEVSNNGDYFNYNYYYVRATVIDVKTDLSTVVYKGCQRDDCKKKMYLQNDGWWYCPKCQKPYQHFKHRYKLQVRLGDGSKKIWITMFDQAISFLGKTASQLVKINRTRTERYKSVLRSHLNETFIFKIKSAYVFFWNHEWRVNRVNSIVTGYQ